MNLSYALTRAFSINSTVESIIQVPFSSFVFSSPHRFPVWFPPHLAGISQCLSSLSFSKMWCAPALSSKPRSLPLCGLLLPGIPFLPGGVCPLTSRCNPDQMLSRLRGYHWALSAFPAFHHILSLISVLAGVTPQIISAGWHRKGRCSSSLLTQKPHYLPSGNQDETPSRIF